jgi:16S rRNA (uracil1498-N3)-methyltransferase
MHRFFLPPDCITKDHIRFPAAISHQIAHVLRLKAESSVIVLDNLGTEYMVILEAINAKECKGRIVQNKQVESEPLIKLSLLISLTQREKFEFILQKCTEIGVNSITPYISNRSLVNSIAVWSKKKERWDRILKEAAEQSGRGHIPLLSEPVEFSEAVNFQSTVKLIAWEGEKRLDLKQVLKSSNVKQVSLMIGPEGGFEETEIQLGLDAGWIPFSLGKRILRMETAAIVASALVLYELGELNLP